MPAVRDAAGRRFLRSGAPSSPTGRTRPAPQGKEGTSPAGRPSGWAAGAVRRGCRRPERRLSELPLSRAYVAREGAPRVNKVDDEIFHRRYFGHCMACGFCADGCCQHGVDVSVVERDRILARAAEIAPRVPTPVSEWFEPSVVLDADFPGGAATRTRVAGDRCVFLTRQPRGCALHGLALEQGEDYHALKPMVSALFPVTFGDETLFCSEELVDGTLVCAGDGPTAYEMARPELAYYFGDALVAELDAMASAVTR